MKYYSKAVILLLSMTLCFSTACGGGSGEDSESAELPVDMKEAVTLTADFSKRIDPPLLKKIAMYNAGCIDPLSNYQRDFARIKEVNADALRIDLSIGKANGTAGQYLVSDDYDITDYDEEKGTFKVDKNSLKYDFKQLDGIVKYMTDYGVLPYMSWDYIPYPLQQDGKWNNLDQNIVNWREVWEEIYYQYAKHYVENGTQIGYHEIYNEPDLEILKCWGVFDETFDGFLNWEDFCLGNECAPGKGVYPDMYEYGAKGILRADPDATIGGPGFALGEIGVEGWVGFLPRVLEKRLPLDFYSFHTYLDGNTWFVPEELRAKGEKNELEKVVSGLSADPYFINTAVHINEYSYLNESNGSTNGLNSQFNRYEGAWRTLDGLMEVVDRPSVQWAYWAQFMESTGGYDPYGMIEHRGGNIKAPFNAMKMYTDMPVWRYEGTLGKENSGLRTLVSSDDDKIGILIWNTNASKDAEGKKLTQGDRVVDVRLNNAKFDRGTRRIYRIDENHGSWFDNNQAAELVAQEEKTLETDGSIWAGKIPADGVVYITVNKDGKKDFTSWEDRISFGNTKDIKTSYYYEDRYRGLEGCREVWEDNVKGLQGSYSHFDRNLWTMYLGMGDCAGLDGKFVGQGHANGSVLCRSLPEKFKVKVRTEGALDMNTKNTTLGFRVDFFDEATGTYTKSVYFHNGLYRDSRDPIAQDAKLAGLPAYPWGTQEKPMVVVELAGDLWEIDLSRYAPDGWNAATGKAQISFDMQNTGAGTRAMFSLIA